jgi:hypothetical protein
VKEVAMLRKGKVPKHKSIAMTLMRDVQGSAAEKRVLFEKLKARGGFDGEEPRMLRKVGNMLEMLAAIEKGSA